MHPSNILNNVSINDIREMYDSGMSVNDIAKLCECSCKTIYRHLEGHAKRHKGGRVSMSIPAHEINKPCDVDTSELDVMTVKNEQNACVVLESCDIRLAGSLGTYSINTKAGEVVAMYGEQMFKIPVSLINTLVEEIKAVGRCAMSFDMGNAMW